jgi:Ca2+-binding RTX toxin-like protein
MASTTQVQRNGEGIARPYNAFYRFGTRYNPSLFLPTWPATTVPNTPGAPLRTLDEVVAQLSTFNPDSPIPDYDSLERFTFSTNPASSDFVEYLSSYIWNDGVFRPYFHSPVLLNIKGASSVGFDKETYVVKESWDAPNPTYNYPFGFDPNIPNDDAPQAILSRWHRVDQNSHPEATPHLVTGGRFTDAVIITEDANGPAPIQLGDDPDSFTGDENVNYIYGGGGSDQIEGLGGDDILRGQDGEDFLWGEAGLDTLLGEAGNDLMFGGDFSDYLNGGTGNDIIYGEAATDLIDGTSGDDILLGGGNHDAIFGGSGNDILYAGGKPSDNPAVFFRDILNGGEGNDTLIGDRGANDLIGGAGNDTLIDLFSDSPDIDSFSGGDGDDTLISGSASDILNGDAGRDRLYGRQEDDTLRGGNNDDLLYAGAGDDILYGGRGSDRHQGDLGADTFVLEAGNGVDTIVDFQDGSDRFAGFQFSQLAFSAVGSATLIRLGTDELALVKNTAPNLITDADFRIV